MMVSIVDDALPTTLSPIRKDRRRVRDRLQARRDAEQKQLKQILDIMEMNESEGQPYNPDDHGFVFSDDQLDAARLLRLHSRQAEKSPPLLLDQLRIMRNPDGNVAHALLRAASRLISMPGHGFS